MLEEYGGLIRSVLKNVPDYLRDDAYQAACLGLINAMRVSHRARNFKSYAWMCMYDEVLNIVAKLNYPMSLDKKTFLDLNRYKKAKHNNQDVDEKLSNKRKKSLSRLLSLKKVSYQVIE